jgi:hypothetical protein
MCSTHSIHLKEYIFQDIIDVMVWDVEYTDQFEEWFDSLDPGAQEDILVSVGLLEERGPSLGRPHVDTLEGTRHPNLKELRTQSKGRPLRTLFAFDPRRIAILLIAGDKTGNRRFYDAMIPLAEELYDEHLEELRKEAKHGEKDR